MLAGCFIEGGEGNIG